MCVKHLLFIFSLFKIRSLLSSILCLAIISIYIYSSANSPNNECMSIIGSDTIVLAVVIAVSVLVIVVVIVVVVLCYVKRYGIFRNQISCVQSI